MRSIAVIYLSRKGNRAHLSRAFLTSLINHPADKEFDLIFLLKRHESNETDDNLIALREFLPCPVREMRCSDETFATNVILDLAAAIEHERVISRTCHSRILAINWLRHYQEAFDSTPACGAVEATGGYECVPGAPFPNVNLRLNACFLPRKRLLELDTGPLKTKRGGNRFEAGPDSFTRQLMARGLAPVVVDRWGKSYSGETWPQSLTFGSGRREGLLIADNRTYHYHVASNRKRLKLAKLNWGYSSVVSDISPIERLRAWWDWHHSESSFFKGYNA